MFMTESFRWYGPDDPVPLAAIRQTGAKGVVSALHELPYGAVWPLEQIENRRQQIARHGLIWNVVESLPRQSCRIVRLLPAINPPSRSLRHPGHHL